MKINQRIRQLVGLSTRKITAKAKALKAQGYDVVNFVGGNPDIDTLDFIKKVAFQTIENGVTEYTPTFGIPELREAISRKFNKDNRFNYQYFVKIRLF